MEYTKDNIIGVVFSTQYGTYKCVGWGTKTGCVVLTDKGVKAPVDSNYPVDTILEHINDGSWIVEPQTYEIF